MKRLSLWKEYLRLLHGILHLWGILTENVDEFLIKAFWATFLIMLLAWFFKQLEKLD
jgi:ABC-type dipeptide/oligopeptide/nickel transport system permease component